MSATTIAVIGEEGEEVAEPSGNGGAPAEAEPQAETAPEEGSRAPARDEERERGRAAATEEPEAETDPTPAPRGDTRVKASPLARRIARERGIDLTTVRGTGPEGRIVAEDVEKAVAPAPASERGVATEIEPRSRSCSSTSVRKTIARRLTEAWPAPVFQLGVSTT